MRWSRPSIPSPRPVRKETLIGFLFLFFTSGACGLIYEVAWQRMLCLVFGNSTFATSTVLAAFMGGMALGSFALGKLSEKARNPARLFAYLEMGIGIWALAMPSLLASASSFHSALYRSLVSHYFLLNISRFAVCFLILAVPTALMGGTLPALARALTGGEVGRSVGLLYGLNTLGAFLGCVLAGFLLMPSIGTEATITLAASFSLAVGLASLFMSRGCSVARVEVEPGRGRTLALVAYAVSGFCALSYEVLWTRALVFFFGSTTYAFTTMLACFLLGLALGSYFFSRCSKDALVLLGVVEVVVGGSAALSIVIFPVLQDVVTRLKDVLGGGWAAFSMARFSAGLLVMFVPTFAMGAAFPLASSIYSSGRVGEEVGTIYGANTLACILGAVGTGFVLLPRLGVTDSILLISSVNLALGAVLLQRTRLGYLGPLAPALLACVGWLSFRHAGPPAVHSGVLRRGRVLYYREHAAGTVTVRAVPPSPYDLTPPKLLEVDGLNVAGTSLELITTQKLQGHLPILIYASLNQKLPENVFVVAFGSGASTYETSLYDVKSITGVEINPAVVEASRFFREINGGIIEDPRYRLFLEDARTFLSSFEGTYDVIESESTHPRINCDLYTLEFFSTCRSRLSEGGVFSCWVPLYSLNEEEVKQILRTFLSCFEDASLWYFPNCRNKHLLLVGTTRKLNMDPKPILKALSDPEVARSLGEIGIEDFEDISACFVAGGRRLREYCGGGKLITADRPSLAYARSMEYMDPERIRELNLIREGTGEVHEAVRRLTEAVALSFEGRWEEAIVEVEEAMRAWRRPWMERFRDMCRSVLLTESGLRNIEERNYMLALRCFQEALGIFPSPLNHNNIGACYVRLKRYDRAISHLKAAIKGWPGCAQAHFNLALAYAAKGMKRLAAFEMRKALRLDPDVGK